MSNYLICLDPGHNSSGADTGAEGFGLREQDITLDIVKRIKPLLEYNGFSVVTTRDGDFVKGSHRTVNESLQTRVNIANNANADLYCSVHINAGGGTGTEVYCYKFGGQAEKLANIMLNSLLETCQWTNRGVKEENLYVIKYTNMPAILTESGFIDTEFDANKLKDSNFIQGIAVAHAKGICDYLGITYKENNNGGGNDVLEVAVLLFSKEDYWSGYDVAVKNGNCGIFTRPDDHSVPKDAMSAKQLVVIGGGKTGHQNEIYLSGDTKYDTAAKVSDYLLGK